MKNLALMAGYDVMMIRGSGLLLGHPVDLVTVTQRSYLFSA